MSAHPSPDGLLEAGPSAHSCPLCGLGFDEGVTKCGGCPMHGGCGTVCCPGCGYSFADRSATLDALTKVGRKLRWLFGGDSGRREASK